MSFTRTSRQYSLSPGNSRSGQQLLPYDWVVYALAFVPALLLLAIAVFQTETPLAYLVKDPLTVAEMASTQCCRSYYGAISNIGILLWCVTATVCMFSALILWLASARSGNARQFAPILLVAGLFSGWLTLDDMFLVHENVAPAFGIPQNLVLGIYGSMTLAYLSISKSLILAGRLPMFVCALGFLSLSVGVDVIATSESFTHVLIEDGAKLIGIAAWTAFHVEAVALVLHGILIGQNNLKRDSSSATPI